MRATSTTTITWVALLSALIGGARPELARADTCSWNYRTDYDDSVGTDDAQWAADVYFRQKACAAGSNATYGTQAKYYWNKMGFVSNYWDDGFGYPNLCDERLPLTRAINGFYALQYSYTPAATSWDDTSGPLVKSEYGYAARGYNQLDDLLAGCYGSSTGTYATTTRGLDDYITLWLPFFMKANAVSRASTLYHESIHYRTGESHTCNEGQDQNWYLDQSSSTPDEPSVYAWHVMWLVSYHDYANANTSSTYKRWAGLRAEGMVDNKFCSPGTIPSRYKNFVTKY